MRVAFTGTRKGLSERQQRRLVEIRNSMPYDIHEFHHGGAVGADTEAAAIFARTAGQVVVHPAGADPLLRNREMVSIADLLIACPAKRQEEQRSGTWATIRYAQKCGTMTLLVYP